MNSRCQTFVTTQYSVSVCCAAILFLFLNSESFGQQTQPDSGNQEIPNTQSLDIPMTPPLDALAMWKMPNGFRATLFAAEPDVHQPIAATFDMKGRLWVVECYTYSDRKENFNVNLNDRVVIFEDTDNDGKFDVRTVFWDEGKKLTGIELGFGGVWLTSAPNLIFVPDRNRDDKPDGPPEILLDGFEDDRVRHNIVNGLRWGPDGWLYGRHGIMATSLVGQPGSTQSQRTPINCGIWRIHPQTKKFEVVAEGGTNPWGFDFDKRGEMFMINTVIGHLFHVVPGARYRRMYGSHFNAHTYQVIEQTADHFHWDTSKEGWAQAKKGSLSDATDQAGGGHAHCGLMIYQGLNWPEDFRDKLYTANFHGRRINCDSFHREGNSYVAHHGKDHFKSDDPWFRGVELLQGPDGGVYVLDWSDIGECHENDGIHRTSGRIFKITFKENETPAPLDLGELAIKELVALQLHRNEWLVRKSRRRLLEIIAEGDKGSRLEIEDAVQTVFQKARADKGNNLPVALSFCKEALFLRQVQANKTEPLDAARLFDPSTVTCDVELVHLRLQWLKYGCRLEVPNFGSLKNSDEHFRAWTVRLLTERQNKIGEAEFQQLLDQANNNPSGLVRLYLASGIRRLNAERAFEIAGILAKYEEDSGDRVQPNLLWYGIEPHIDGNIEAAIKLAADSKIDLLTENISRRIAGELDEDPGIVETLLTKFTVPAVGNGEVSVTAHQSRLCLTGIAKALEGWNRAKEPLAWKEFCNSLTSNANSSTPSAKVAATIQSLNLLFGDQVTREDLLRTIANNKASTESRCRAIEALGQLPADEKLFDVLAPLVGRAELTNAVIKGFAKLENPKISGLLLNRFKSMDPLGQTAAIDLLTVRKPFARRLLTAVENGLVDRSRLTASHARRIANFDDPEINRRLAKVWGRVRTTNAEKLGQIERLTDKLSAEAIKNGELLVGQKLFADHCASCHVLKGQGGLVGPDLTGSDRKNLSYLLENIVDPSSTVADSYRSANVLLFDGRLLEGIVISETDRVLKLQTKDALLSIDQDDVDAIKKTERSLMPEGLLEKLSDKEIRSLVKFLQN